MRIPCLLLALAMTVLALPPAGAQPAPGALYFTATVLEMPPTGAKVFEMSAAAPTAAESQKAYAQNSPGPVTYENRFDYTATETLSLSGMLTVSAFVSCDKAALLRPGVGTGPNPAASSRAILYVGGTEVSQSSRYDTFTPCTGPSYIQELTYEVDSGDATIAKGQILQVAILVWWTNADNSAASNGHFLVGSTAHPSGIRGVGLPTGGPGGGQALPPVTETLTTVRATVGHNFTSPHNTTYIYTWNATAQPLELTVAASVASGSVNVTVRDPQNATSYSAVLSANGTVERDLQGAAGAWTIELSYAAFTGSLQLDLGAASTTTTSTSGTSDPSTSMASSSTSSQAAPHLGVAALALVLAFAARRRR